MSAMLDALIANQARVREQILDEEACERRIRKAAARTRLTGYNEYGWATGKAAKAKPRPYFTTESGGPNR